MFRRGVEALLDGETGIDIQSLSPTDVKTGKMHAGAAPDVVLVDLPGLDRAGAQMLKGLRDQIGSQPIIILGSSEEQFPLAGMVKLGVWGYLDREAEPTALVDAIRKTAKGETILPPEATTRLLQRIQNDAREPLTEREREILNLVAGGSRNRDIACQLVVEESTVRWHMHNILQKLGARTRTDAVRIARERGMLFN